jgi:hypothetical protein
MNIIILINLLYYPSIPSDVFVVPPPPPPPSSFIVSSIRPVLNIVNPTESYIRLIISKNSYNIKIEKKIVYCFYRIL